MRSMLAVLALSALGLLTSVEPINAEITYPWCAQYSGGRGGGRNCGFTTWEQCRATVHGVGGYCELNSMYPGSAPPVRRKPRRHYG